MFDVRKLKEADNHSGIWDSIYHMHNIIANHMIQSALAGRIYELPRYIC